MISNADLPLLMLSWFTLTQLVFPLAMSWAQKVLLPLPGTPHRISITGGGCNPSTSAGKLACAVDCSAVKLCALAGSFAASAPAAVLCAVGVLVIPSGAVDASAGKSASADTARLALSPPSAAIAILAKSALLMQGCDSD